VLVHDPLIPMRPGLFAKVRPWILLVIAAAAIAYTLVFLNVRQPLSQWMFWRYGAVYAFTLLFGVACFCAGHAVLAWPCRRDPMVPSERLLLDMAAGVLVFALGTFLVGIGHGLGAIYFWAFPSLLIALGMPFVLRDASRSLAQRLLDRQRARHAPSLPATLAVAFGAIGLVLVYLPLLTTENASFDSRWYHLAIAEHYVAAGRIAAFREGWILGALPHLSSWLYTWALAWPLYDLHARIELAAHMEFLLFLLTLAGIPLLIERLLVNRRVRGMWALCFLFPGLFLYDSNLVIGADHVLAFWAVPLALALIRLASATTPTRAIVLAMVFAGTAMTKVQSVYLLAPAGLFVLGCSAVRVCRRADRLARLGFVLAVPLLGSILLFTAAHWLPNLIWHHNPVYPLLGEVFPSRPWRAEMAKVAFDTGWTPVGSFWARVEQTLESPFTFAFLPHDWVTFHRDLPVFGFLFTLSLPLLPFLPRTRRIWAVTVAVWLGVIIWFWTYHQDRYLQALLPWMVAATGATFVLVWHAGKPARLGIIGLVALQLIWSGDIPFLPTHAMAAPNPIEHVLKLLSSTYRKDDKSRIDNHTGYNAVADALPKDAVVMLHVKQMRLGIGRPVVSDSPRWSAGPLLGQLDGPAAAWRQLKDYGVTHLLFLSDTCDPDNLNLRSEVATHTLAERASDKVQSVDGKTVVTLATQEPAQDTYGDVAYSGCGTRGRIPWENLDTTYEADREASTDSAKQLLAIDEALFAGLDSAVVDDRCTIEFPAAVADKWLKVAHWKHALIYVRRAH